MKNCTNCKKSKIIHATGGWSFIGCMKKPYRGKCVNEIVECPMEGVKDEDCTKNDEKGPSFDSLY